MTHDKIQERLSEWLDGELEDALSAEASRHIDACAVCKDEVVRLRRIGTALFQAPAPIDPRSTEAFVARVMGLVVEESVTPLERFAARFLVPAFGLGLAASLFMISLPADDADAPLGVSVVSVDVDSFLEVAP